MNRELGADFQLDRFGHEARYNPRRNRIEMHLVSGCDQSAAITGRRFRFSKGEPIRTEYCHKYSLADLAQLGADAGCEGLDRRAALFQCLVLHSPLVRQPLGGATSWRLQAGPQRRRVTVSSCAGLVITSSRRDAVRTTQPLTADRRWSDSTCIAMEKALSSAAWLDAPVSPAYRGRRSDAAASSSRLANSRHSRE
jgi:hypothetical protein